MLLKEPHCLGFVEPKEQTVRQWIKNQGLEIDNPINDWLMDIISLKRQRLPGPLDPKSYRLVYRALYDLDDFKNRMLADNFFQNLEIASEKLSAAMSDDTVLLEIAMEWVKQLVFKSERFKSSGSEVQ